MQNIQTSEQKVSASSISSIDISQMSNHDLFALCKEYGRNSRFWLKKFGALLPEVLRRGIYKKKFYSIYQFASQLAGMSQKTVGEILHVNEKLKDKPLLLAQMEKQGWSKMRVVANVATKETEQFWVEKVQILPKRALEMYISEMKKEGKEENSEDGIAGKSTAKSGETLFSACEDFLPGEKTSKDSPKVKFVSMSFKVDPETEFRLRKFQQKLEKERKQTVTFNEVLRTLLDQAEENKRIEQKGRVAKIAMPEQNEPTKQIEDKPVSRHVSNQKHRAARGSGHCSHPGCNKPATEIHHIDRFSISQNHENIISLCHEHHILEHAEGIGARTRETSKKNQAERRVDQKYFEHLNAGKGAQ